MLSFRMGPFFGKNLSGFGIMAALMAGHPLPMWNGILSVPLSK
jgi:hypothetical protein